MTPKPLTNEMIRGCFYDLDKRVKNWKTAKAAAAIIGATGLLFPLLSSSLFIMLPLFVFIAILLLVIEWKALYDTRCVHQKDYMLEADVCIGKDRGATGDGDEFPYLTFEHAGRYYIGSAKLHSSDNAASALSQVYETAEAGDTFYLLRNRNKRLLYVFNSKFWEIDENEFVLSNDVYVPKV